MKKLIALCIMLFAVNVFAGQITCPNLTLNGTAYAPCESVTSGTCHYITPYIAPASIYSAYTNKTWTGNGSENANSNCGDNADYATCGSGPAAYLHWVSNSSNLVISHGCAGNTPTPTPTPTPPTPTPTPTPPPPTPTPTPTPTPPPDPTPTPTPGCVPNDNNKPTCSESDCDKILEWINNCGDKKYVTCDKCACIPERECGENECGSKMDNCGEWFACRNNCPPPPPPPGRWPDYNCDACNWSQFLYIRNWTLRAIAIPNASIEGIISQVQYLHFGNSTIVRQLILDADENSTYVVWNGNYTGDKKDWKELYRFTGPGTVTVPYPSSGYPIQQWTDVWFTGGDGSMTVFVDDKNHIWIRTVEGGL